MILTQGTHLSSGSDHVAYSAILPNRIVSAILICPLDPGNPVHLLLFTLFQGLRLYS